MAGISLQFLNAALVIAFIVMVITLNGCEILAASAAGVGAGYFIAKEERPAKQVMTDASITGEIKTKYLQDEAINALDINVDTYNANVTLSGTVNSAQEVQHAINIAQNVKGVNSVTSKLTIEPEKS